MDDRCSVLNFGEVLVIKVEGERELGGVLDWRGDEWLIDCEFVGCVKIFQKVTFLVYL